MKAVDSVELRLTCKNGVFVRLFLSFSLAFLSLFLFLLLFFLAVDITFLTQISKSPLKLTVPSHVHLQGPKDCSPSLTVYPVDSNLLPPHPSALSWLSAS